MSFRTRCASARFAVIDGGSAATGSGSQPGDREGENHEGCLSYAGAHGDTPHHSRQAHREGPVRHGSTTLAAVTDTGNREPGLNEPKSRAKRVQTDAAPRGSRRLDGGSHRRRLDGAGQERRRRLCRRRSGCGAEVPALPVPERAIGGTVGAVRCWREVTGAPSFWPRSRDSCSSWSVPRPARRKRRASACSSSARRRWPPRSRRQSSSSTASKAACHRPAATLRASTREAAALDPQGANRAPGAARRAEDAPRVPAPARGAAPLPLRAGRAGHDRGHPRGDLAGRRDQRPGDGQADRPRLPDGARAVTRREAADHTGPGEARRPGAAGADAARDRVAATAADLEQARSERTSYIASLRQEQQLTAAQIGRLQEQARAAAEKAREVQQQTTAQPRDPDRHDRHHGRSGHDDHRRRPVRAAASARRVGLDATRLRRPRSPRPPRHAPARP